MFIYLLTERERAGEGQREREKENPKQDPHCKCIAQRGAWTHEPRDRALSRNQESNALTDCVTQVPPEM